MRPYCVAEIKHTKMLQGEVRKKFSDVNFERKGGEYFGSEKEKSSKEESSKEESSKEETGKEESSKEKEKINCWDNFD